MTQTQDIQIKARARCFRGANGRGTLAAYTFQVEADGTVRVYDGVARHYTIHHGMTPREESRIRNLAMKAALAEAK